MRTIVAAAYAIVVGSLAWGQGVALVATNAIPNPGSEVTFQVLGSPAGAQFRWDFNGDGRADTTTNQPWASWTVPAGYWEITVDVIQGGKVLSRVTAAVVADARVGAFRSARWSGGVLEVTVTLRAKQSLVAPAVVETVPPGWVATVVDDGGAVYRRGDVLEVLWATSLDPGMELRFVYTLHPPTGGAPVRLSGAASGYQEGRRVEARVAGVVAF